MWQQRLRWKLNRLRLQWAEFIEPLRNLWKGTQTATRMCPSCRALVGVNETSCSFCGSGLKRRPSGMGKFLQNFLPQYTPVSYTLLTVNFLFFLLMLAVDWDPASVDIRQLLMGGSPQLLIAWGADVGWLVAHGHWWRLFAAVFIHIGAIHLLFNCYALLFIGPLLEEILGRDRFFVLYIVTGVAGFWVSNIFHSPLAPTAGASGALFGMIGVALTLSQRYSTWGSLLHQQLKHWAIYGFIYGFFIGANNAAHLGGFLSGVALAFIVGNPSLFSDKTPSRLLWTGLYWLCLLLTVGSLCLAIISRFLNMQG
jgi:rhomboid protease GluP